MVGKPKDSIREQDAEEFDNDKGDSSAARSSSPQPGKKKHPFKWRLEEASKGEEWCRQQLPDAQGLVKHPSHLVHSRNVPPLLHDLHHPHPAPPTPPHPYPHSTPPSHTPSCPQHHLTQFPLTAPSNARTRLRCAYGRACLHRLWACSLFIRVLPLHLTFSATGVLPSPGDVSQQALPRPGAPPPPAGSSLHPSAQEQKTRPGGQLGAV